METLLMIDGENFKKKISAIIRDILNEKVIWEQFNFKRLIEEKTGILSNQINFYGAKIKEYKESFDVSQRLIQEQRSLKNSLAKQGIEMILAGQVRRQGNVSNTGNYSFKKKA